MLCVPSSETTKKNDVIFKDYHKTCILSGIYNQIYSSLVIQFLYLFQYKMAAISAHTMTTSLVLTCIFELLGNIKDMT